jgi:hypothetical protein
VPAEDVMQEIGGERLEKASEFGEPTGLKTAPGYVSMGAMFDWYDRASRYTWRFLINASADQIRDATDRMFEADSLTVHDAVLNALFYPTARSNEFGTNNVFPLYNNDGTVPPAFGGQTFLSTHTHYFASNAAAVDSQDLELLIDAVREHGFTVTDGGTLVVLAPAAIVDVIRTFRAGATNNNSQVAKYDFVPSQAAPAFFSSEQLVGELAPSTFNGLKVAGSYNDALIVPSFEIPSNYMLSVATYGANNERNVLSFREHPDASLRGFRLVKGKTPDYPLQDSFYMRGFGTGVRRRGAAAVMEVTVGATYDAPAAYATPGA